MSQTNSTTWSPHVFGVRHLSPSGAWHLKRFLDRVRPKLVLIEGLSDASGLTSHWVKKGTVPPIAILAYTTSLPVRTLVYPMARYSPEYQAVLWAHANKAEAEFIDLPSDVFLGLQDRRLRRIEASAAPNGVTSDEETTEDDSANGTPSKCDSNGEEPSNSLHRIEIYDRIAKATGELSYDSYWERQFEHNLTDESYRKGAQALGESLRDFEEDLDEHLAENLVREAYMRRQIEQAVARGLDQNAIVVVTGAFHASVLNSAYASMTDEEFAKLPRLPSKLTLMPYSYFKLSEQSGYGAGNRAPAYFEMMWDSLNENALEELPNKYLSTIAGRVRNEGTHRSTAEVIEGVRLAKTLAGFRDSSQPTLQDLHDAAVTLLGHGELSSVAEAIAHTDVGTAIGRLPEGVSRTSIQDDFERLIRELKLEKYKTTVAQELTLDLRENRQAKSESAAFLDLRRSSFLHRLRLLGIEFAKFGRTAQQSATWAEQWQLQWSPESEISLVESVLLGETVELAVAYNLKQRIEQATSIEDAAKFVADALQANLPGLMELARSQVQALSVANPSVASLAEAAYRLLYVVQFGDVRKSDVSTLLPMIRELFVQATLNLFEAANCDNAAAVPLVAALDQLNRISLELYEIVDEAMWQRELRRLSDSDSRSPVISGFACGLLLERNWLPNERLASEVSRRLSPGVAADLGAGWFEGLAMRNRYSLIARQVLWEQLSEYVDQLEEQEFRRSLMFLRRAFGAFSPNEKRSIVENLANYWGSDGEEVNEQIENPLTESDKQAIDDLNEFDFDNF